MKKILFQMKKLMVIGLLVPLCAGMLCPSHKFWSSNTEKCINCSKCKEGEFISRPCQVHKDTMCSPVSELMSNMKSSLPWLHNDETIFLEKNRIHYLDDIVESKAQSHSHHLGHIDVEIVDSPEQVHRAYNRPDKHKTEHHHKKKVRNRPEGEKPNKVKHQHYLFDSDDEDIFQANLKNSQFPKTNKQDVFPARMWKKDEEDKQPHLTLVRDEKELQKWLIQSRNKLKHRKDDLMKIVKEEHFLSDSDDETRIKLNHPIYKLDAKLIKDLLNHESHSNKSKKHQNNMSDLDFKIVKELVTEEKNKNLELIDLMSKLPPKPHKNYKPIVPAHRMFLGEPSTVSEIIGQVKDPQEIIKEEFGKNVIHERPKISVLPFVHENEDVVSVPFSTAEKFVSDWQVVAFVSAIVSCLLFFVVAIIYTVLNARQWRRVKIRYEVGEYLIV